MWWIRNISFINRARKLSEKQKQKRSPTVPSSVNLIPNDGIH